MQYLWPHANENGQSQVQKDDENDEHNMSRYMMWTQAYDVTEKG